MDAPAITKQQLTQVYNWVDQIPLSRPKKNISRDFSDGVLMAEILHYYFPKFVQMHNYPAASSVTQKYNNWNTLNQKILRKIGYQVSKTDIQHVITATPDEIQKVLRMVQIKIQQYFEKKKQGVVNLNINNDQKQLYDSIQKKGTKQPKQLKGQLNEKQNSIRQLRQAIEVLQLKLKKMDQLNKLKDMKIQTLVSKLQQAGIQ